MFVLDKSTSSNPQSGVLPLNMYPGMQHGMVPTYQVKQKQMFTLHLIAFLALVLLDWFFNQQ